MDVTGLLLNHSGRLESLENRDTYINQQLLQRPDIAAFTQFQNIWNRQITDLSNLVTTINNSVRTLQQLYVNLNQVVSSNFSTFTGHTGNVSLHS